MAKRKTSPPAKRSRAPAVAGTGPLLRDVIDLVQPAREATATAINCALVQLPPKEVLQNKLRAIAGLARERFDRTDER